MSITGCSFNLMLARFICKFGDQGDLKMKYYLITNIVHTHEKLTIEYQSTYLLDL